MNKEELKTIVAQMLRELHTGEHPEPAVKAADYKPRLLFLFTRVPPHLGQT